MSKFNQGPQSFNEFRTLLGAGFTSIGSHFTGRIIADLSCEPRCLESVEKVWRERECDAEVAWREFAEFHVVDLVIALGGLRSEGRRVADHMTRGA